MKLKQYCTVKLKNGKTATIVEIFQKDGEDDEYIADLDVERFKWETVTIYPDDIEEIIRE